MVLTSSAGGVGREADYTAVITVTTPSVGLASNATSGDQRLLKLKMEVCMLLFSYIFGHPQNLLF